MTFFCGREEVCRRDEQKAKEWQLASCHEIIMIATAMVMVMVMLMVVATAGRGGVGMVAVVSLSS